jgi:hypothetical protein
MQIIDRRQFVRPDTSIPFFNTTGTTPGGLAYKTVFDQLVADGKLVRDVVISEDGLTQSVTFTHDSLETLTARYSAFGIGLEKEFSEYCAEYNVVSSFTIQEGIDVPFTCTTTYTYNENTINLYPQFESFIQSLTVSITLEEFTNTGTQLIAVHRYENSEDYNVTRWRETSIPGMVAGGITRTMEFKLV